MAAPELLWAKNGVEFVTHLSGNRMRPGSQTVGGKTLATPWRKRSGSTLTVIRRPLVWRLIPISRRRQGAPACVW